MSSVSDIIAMAKEYGVPVHPITDEFSLQQMLMKIQKAKQEQGVHAMRSQKPNSRRRGSGRAPRKLINPKTGKSINRGGPTHQRLCSEYNMQFDGCVEAFPELTIPPEAMDPAKMGDMPTADPDVIKQLKMWRPETKHTIDDYMMHPKTNAVILKGGNTHEALCREYGDDWTAEWSDGNCDEAYPQIAKLNAEIAPAKFLRRGVTKEQKERRKSGRKKRGTMKNPMSGDDIDVGGPMHQQLCAADIVKENCGEARQQQVHDMIMLGKDVSEDDPLWEVDDDMLLDMFKHLKGTLLGGNVDEANVNPINKDYFVWAIRTMLSRINVDLTQPPTEEGVPDFSGMFDRRHLPSPNVRAKYQELIRRATMIDDWRSNLGPLDGPIDESESPFGMIDMQREIETADQVEVPVEETPEQKERREAAEAALLANKEASNEEWDNYGSISGFDYNAPLWVDRSYKDYFGRVKPLYEGGKHKWCEEKAGGEGIQGDAGILRGQCSVRALPRPSFDDACPCLKPRKDGGCFISEDRKGLPASCQDFFNHERRFRELDAPNEMSSLDNGKLLGNEKSNIRQQKEYGVQIGWVNDPYYKEICGPNDYETTCKGGQPFPTAPPEGSGSVVEEMDYFDGY